MDTLGIIAGGGQLPLAVAQSARSRGRSVFIVGLRGSAKENIGEFPHDWTSLGETKRTFQLLRDHGCTDVVLCGRVSRPRFSDARPDIKGVLMLPRLISAARKGDDALLRAVVDIFREEGFRSVGVDEAAPDLLATEGAYTRASPSPDNLKDVEIAVRVVRRLGALDVGQSAAVCEGLVLAVEAAEGTDAMIARVAHLPEHVRGTMGSRKGVLVKALKPVQDRKTDLPVIGVQTVLNVASAGLAGIAIEAGNALVINRAGVVAAADEAGIFVLGFAPSAYAD